MAPQVSDEVLVKIVELAGDLTKNAKHPSAAVTSDNTILEYRITLFGKTVKALYQAVSQADKE